MTIFVNYYGYNRGMRFEKTQKVIEDKQQREREIRDAKLALWVEVIRQEGITAVLNRFVGLMGRAQKNISRADELSHGKNSQQKQLQEV